MTQTPSTFIAVCYGNRTAGEVLYFLFESASSQETPLVTCTLDDIAKEVLVSKKTLVTHIRQLETWGYIKADGYRHIYEVFLEKIMQAINFPPQPLKRKLRGRHAVALRGTYIPFSPIDIREEDAQIARLQMKRARLLAELQEIETELATHTSVIYALFDPRTLTAFYIGISLDGKRRFKEHLSCIDENEEKNAHIQRLLDLGLEPLYVELETVLGRTHALEREKYWIRSFLARGTHLTNRDEVAS